MSKKSKDDKREVVVTDGVDGDGGRSVPGAIAGALISPLVGAPRQLGTALEDLRSIAECVKVLPEVLESLSRIDERVASLDEEVITMRHAVQGLETKVEGLDGSMAHLGDGIKDVGSHVDRLEPHLIEMKASLQPFKRWTGRVNRSAASSRAEAMDEKPGD